jgi:hypothetical protein
VRDYERPVLLHSAYTLCGAQQSRCLSRMRLHFEKTLAIIPYAKNFSVFTYQLKSNSHLHEIIKGYVFLSAEHFQTVLIDCSFKCASLRPVTPLCVEFC